jgi:ABC-type antimicrobial peptide transport system permease subunit
MALGATENAISRMILGEALGLTVVGIVLGMPIAYFGKRLAATLINDLPVTSAFPMIFGLLTILIIALMAAHVPARRAARVDPMQALRYE